MPYKMTIRFLKALPIWLPTLRISITYVELGCLLILVGPIDRSSILVDAPYCQSATILSAPWVGSHWWLYLLIWERFRAPGIDFSIHPFWLGRIKGRLQGIFLLRWVVLDKVCLLEFLRSSSCFCFDITESSESEGSQVLKQLLRYRILNCSRP